MKRAIKALKSFTKDECGQSLIEYALVAGLIGLAAVVTMTSLGSKIAAAFTTIGTTLSNSV